MPPLEEEGTECSTCSLSVIIKPSMMEIVETLNPGQPPLPDWVYNGAILGGSRYPSLLSPQIVFALLQTQFNVFRSERVRRFLQLYSISCEDQIVISKLRFIVPQMDNIRNSHQYSLWSLWSVRSKF